MCEVGTLREDIEELQATLSETQTRLALLAGCVFFQTLWLKANNSVDGSDLLAHTAYTSAQTYLLAHRQDMTPMQYASLHQYIRHFRAALDTRVDPAPYIEWWTEYLHKGGTTDANT